MIQGVRDVFEMVDMDDDSSTRGQGRGQSQSQSQPQAGGGEGKIVLIGRGLSGLPVEESLLGAMNTQM